MMMQQEGATSQSENLQVYLRVRPFTASERDSGESQECVTMEGPDRHCGPESSEELSIKTDRVISPSHRRLRGSASLRCLVQSPVRGTCFEGSVRGLVRDVLEGENCLVFTYAVTNAGKTFTFLASLSEPEGRALPIGTLSTPLWWDFASQRWRAY
ncbi:kinesin-like protein KIF20A isoform X2 [Solea solea]|uniref:kinesin-like protein KIF20A isoform X2 n=1 Tax=Solea solea TaxID=90069 RepID=UPI00272D989E|nr:kinesin-like protein KIF20A isoform X2 [Solea solea]